MFRWKWHRLAANKELRQGLAALRADHKEAYDAKESSNVEMGSEMEKLRTTNNHLQQKVPTLLSHFSLISSLISHSYSHTYSGEDIRHK